MASQDWIKSSEQVLAGRFEDQTGIHIDFQIIPADQYFDVLKTKLNSGQGIDLFLGQAGKSDMKLQYDAAKNAVDLTSEAWVKSLDPVVADQSSLDGKLYGAEVWDVVAANYWVIVYNKDIFSANSLSVPKTFDEFETVCDTLLKKGITPVYEPVSDGWHHVLWFPSVGGQTGGAGARPERQAQREHGDLRRRCEHGQGPDPAQRSVQEGLLRQERAVRQRKPTRPRRWRAAPTR